MDPGCDWHCKNHPTPLKSDFCNGAMDMLMTGFETAGTNPSNPCVILFIKAWTLDTRAKFGLACVGVAALGFAVEAVIALRRKLSSPRRLSPYLSAPPSVKRIVSVALFGLNLALGYLAMLVAMTYSFELFLCVVLGLMAGHAFFNVRERVGESIDPCCAPSQNNDQAYLVVESGGGGSGGCPAASTPTVMGPVTRTPSCSGPCGASGSSSDSQTRPIILKSQDSPPPYRPPPEPQPDTSAQQTACCKDPSAPVLT